MCASEAGQTAQESSFWDLIAKARQTIDGDDDQLPEELVRLLATETKEAILDFGLAFAEFHNRSYTSNLWCTAYVACGGCSDDGFDYFRAWLIGRGKDAYYNALQDPDSLAGEFEDLKNAGGFPENEMMLAVASSAYEKKTGNSDYYDELDKLQEIEPREDIEFDWSEEDESSMRKVCPKVFEMFWDDPF